MTVWPCYVPTSLQTLCLWNMTFYLATEQVFGVVERTFLAVRSLLGRGLVLHPVVLVVLAAFLVLIRVVFSQATVRAVAGGRGAHGTR